MTTLDFILIITAVICFFSCSYLLLRSYKAFKLSKKIFYESDISECFTLIDQFYSDPSLLDDIIINYNKLSLSDQKKIREGFEYGIIFSKFTFSKNLLVPVPITIKSTVPSGENKK